MMDKLHLLRAFTSCNSSRDFFENLIQALNAADPAVAVLALEGLYRIESDVKGRQFPQIPTDEDQCQEPTIEMIRNFLRKWRCEWPLGEYSGAFKRVPRFLRGLTIFKTLQVPLFIDDYGTKKPLSSFKEVAAFSINKHTAIYHVTHKKEAELIDKDKEFKPSDNKNIIKGCWFGLDNSKSVYGSKAFQTSLYQLGVTGLRQGEIVCYKKETNIILYAVDDANFEGLKKPTDETVKADPGAYINVSIFVPSRFLPEPGRFGEVISGPIDVEHGPFCVKVKRKTIGECPELQE